MLVETIAQVTAAMYGSAFLTEIEKKEDGDTMRVEIRKKCNLMFCH
ncbi:MAG: hypothetical protein RR683_09320 [Lachnospiraceae bacterium]